LKKKPMIGPAFSGFYGLVGSVPCMKA